MADDPAWPLAQHVCRTGYADLPASAVEAARRDILDTFGGMLDGSGSPGIDELFAVISRWGGLEESRALIHGARVPALLGLLYCDAERPFRPAVPRDPDDPIRQRQHRGIAEPILLGYALGYRRGRGSDRVARKAAHQNSARSKVSRLRAQCGATAVGRKPGCRAGGNRAIGNTAGCATADDAVRWVIGDSELRCSHPALANLWSGHYHDR
jgi:hypothetical protein